MTNSLKDMQSQVLGPALALLPGHFDSAESRVMLLAIGLQESGFNARVQRLAGGGKGPARGFWQCERGTRKTRGGVTGVALHEATRGLFVQLCGACGCEPEPGVVWQRIEFDDLLAAGVARLLLYADAAPLPTLGDAQAAWQTYLRVWRPGKPRRESWDAFYAQAGAVLLDKAVATTAA